MSKLSSVCHFPYKMSCDSLVLLGPCVTRPIFIGIRCVQICSAALTLPHTGHWKFQYGATWQRYILLRHCNAVYNQNTIDRWMKVCILPFPKKGDLGLAKNYRGITLTSIAAKIYNALLRNRIEPKIDNILRKNQNGFRRNRSTSSQILTIRRILEGVRAKNLQATLLFVDFTKAFDSIHRGNMEQILLAYGLPKETVAAITILYRNTKVKVRSPDGDRILRHCSRSTTRRYASPIPLYHLSG